MRRTVVDVTPGTIRVLQADGEGRAWKIRQVIVEPLQGQDAPARLAQLIRQHKIPRRVVAAFPREQAITRLMKFPTVDPVELATMFELSGKTQLPYPPEQALADFRVIDEQAGMSLVQVVSCRRDSVERSLALLRQAGLEPELVTLSSWGLLAWYLRLAEESPIQEPAAVVNIDGDRTDLVLIQQGRLIFSRSLSQGAQDWMEEQGISQLVQELERSIASLRKDVPGVEANTVVLTGIGPLEQWRGAFEERLRRPVVTKPVQFASVTGPAARADVSIAVSLGLAMAERDWLVNLLPREVSQSQQQRYQVRELAISGALLLMALAMGAGLLSIHVGRQQRLAEETAALVRKLESTTKQTERKARDMKAIDGILTSRWQTAAMLAELLKRTPDPIRFESIGFERPRMELTVRGSAPTTREVLNYVRQLEESQQWKGVELRYSSRRSGAAGARTDFEIVMRRGAG